MTEIVTLEIPDALAQSARAVAAKTHRRVEDVAADLAALLPADLEQTLSAKLADGSSLAIA